MDSVYKFTNDHVTAGDILGKLFSQEYLSMQSEYLQASARLKRAQQSSVDEQSTATSIYRSARQRLIVIGLGEEELNSLESSRTPNTYLDIRAPLSGTILEDKVHRGESVTVGSDLFEIADLSTLWVLADVYEKDLHSIKQGMNVLIDVSAYPESFEGVIKVVYNVADEKTRTVKTRIEVNNRSHKLKPQMFCTVRVNTHVGNESIAIPASALLGDAEENFVFIAKNDSTFEKRDVRIGTTTHDFVQVLDGLLVGEKIVARGGFFLKSELGKESYGE
jgi:Cu(I)/Ag(I) efflux system membrane fusion protein